MSELNTVTVLANRSLLTWQVKALEQLVDETGIEIPLVVINTVDDFAHPGYSRGASSLEVEAFEPGVGMADFKLFYHIAQRERAWVAVLAERKLAWMLGLDKPGPMDRCPIDQVDVLTDADHIQCTPVPVNGAWCDLPEAIVERIANETDLAIRFGFNLLTGRILSAPKYGVISFHPGDIRRYRGLSPARMFLNGEETAGATLQQLTNELDGGNVVAIESVNVSDVHTLDELQRRLAILQSKMLTNGIKRLRDPDFKPEPPESLAEYVSVSRRQDPLFAGRVLAKNIIGRFQDCWSNS